MTKLNDNVHAATLAGGLAAIIGFGLLLLVGQPWGMAVCGASGLFIGSYIGNRHRTFIQGLVRNMLGHRLKKQ